MLLLEMEKRPLRKIISGGQVGVDRAALEAARSLGVETGGWAPKGWRTSAGPDARLAEFGLLEHSSTEYQHRTRLNVRDSDATLVIGSNLVSPGCKCTTRVCHDLKKPVFYLKTTYTPEQHANLIKWVQENGIEVLNVAGNRDKRGQQPPNYHYDIAFKVIKELILVLRRDSPDTP